MADGPACLTTEASQAQRTRALAGFKANDFQILVATDIARGASTSTGRAVNAKLPRVRELRPPLPISR